MAQCALEQWDAGLASSQRAAELDSTLAQAYLGIAVAAKGLGALDEAEAALERATALKPDSPRFRDLLEEVQHLRTQTGNM